MENRKDPDLSFEVMAKRRGSSTDRYEPLTTGYADSALPVGMSFRPGSILRHNRGRRWSPIEHIVDADGQHLDVGVVVHIERVRDDAVNATTAAASTAATAAVAGPTIVHRKAVQPDVVVLEPHGPAGCNGPFNASARHPSTINSGGVK